ncbi:MAG: alpha/beta hydrolase [Alistipes sp.]|nr:alpha/beta hydrolase [Alistipes sp.]
MKRLLLLIGIAMLAVTASAQQPVYQTCSDISYVESTDAYAAERCKLDVYYPQDAVGCPVVVWFHGGGLTGGNKSIPKPLRECGMVVVAVNYRLMPQAGIEECIDDAAAAVAWTFCHVAEYGGDVKKIFVAGHSAGGYLTSMIGLDKSWLAKYGIDADSIAALIPFSGQAITHFAHRQLQGLEATRPTIDSLAPLYHVRADAPPLIIISGDREQELYGRYEEQAYFWRMMKLTGHKETYLYELDGFNHSKMATPAFHILKTHINAIAKESDKRDE